MQLADDKKQKIYDKALGAIKHWLERFDTIIIGPGLGRDEMVHHVVIEVPFQCIYLNLLVVKRLVQAHSSCIIAACGHSSCIDLVHGHLLQFTHKITWTHKITCS